MKFWLAVVFLIIIDRGQAMSQQVWSYQACAQYALDHNLDIRNSSLDVESQEVVFRSRKFSLLPTVDARAGYGINQGRVEDPNTSSIVESQFFSNSYSINATLPLFLGFRAQNRIAFERYNLYATQELLQMRKNELVFNVLDAYVTHLLNQGLVVIQQEQHEIAMKERDRVHKLIEVGRLSGTERFEAEARLSEDEYLLLNYKNKAKISEYNLRKLMNFPQDSLINIVEPEVDLLPVQSVSQDSVYTFAANNLSSIKYYKSLQSASKKALHVSRGGLMPALYLYGSWNTGFYETRVDEEGRLVPFKDQFQNNENINYGLSLQIPIFQSFATRSEIHISKITQEKATNSLAAELINLRHEVNENLLMYDAAVSEYQAAIKKQESNTFAFEAAGKKREKGLISIMDFYESKTNLAKAQSEVLRTRLQIFLNDKTLQFYLTGSIL